MEKLGIELPLLITQIINFSILIFILTKFLYKPILRSLNDRKKKIEESLAFSQQIKQEEEKLEEKKREVLRNAKDEARTYIEQAKKDGKKIKEEMEIEAKKEISLLKEKLEKEMKSREEELTDEITSYTVHIAAEMVKRLLPDVIKTEDQHRIIQKQLEKLQRSHEKKQ